MKKILTLACFLILIGTMLFTLAACTGGGFAKIFGGNTVETVKTVDTKFENISIFTDTANIIFLPSEDETCKVVACDKTKVRYDATVENGTLILKSIDERNWFERAFNFFQNATLKVYLPESTYSALTIEEDTGDISIPADFSFKSIDIELSTGNTDLRSSVSDFISIDGSTGNVYVKDISCGSLSIDVSTGNVSLSNVDCFGEVEIEVSTGNVYANNIKLGNLESEGDTGYFSAKNVIASGNVYIERSTGKVTIEDATVSGNLTTETSTGNTSFSKINCIGDVNMHVTTGKTTLTDVKCNNLTTVGDTGWIDMVDVIASGKLEIERSTGDVTFTRCDASEITILTDTGDVRGTLLSEKIFIYDTDTGDVDIPETMSGGKCKITTDTGDIVISIE